MLESMAAKRLKIRKKNADPEGLEGAGTSENLNGERNTYSTRLDCPPHGFASKRG